MLLYWRRVLYGTTIFTSALLLFLIQPVMARAILPWFGGSAGVWTTAMLFFQVLLLAGYWWAHRVATRLSARTQAALHITLLAASLALLPVVPAARWKPSGADHPVLAILALLATSVGLPYFLLSTTTPLLQSWFARETGRSPYRLFAVSNLASLAALLAYPVAVEPLLPLRAQLTTWSAAYAAFALLCGASALASLRTKVAYRGEEAPTPWRERLLWVALAACPSAMWMAVANHLSQNVSPMPFLWILPLALYLLTLILCFDREGWYRPHVFKRLLPVGVAAICFGLWHPFDLTELRWSIPSFGAGLFLCAMFCHGELARRKPKAAELTSFYLMLSAGGAAGGAFVALLAPQLFTGYFELQVTVIACILLALSLLYGVASARQQSRLVLAAVAGFIIAVQLRGTMSGGGAVRARNFYGAIEITEHAGMRLLYNGAILHGSQFLDDARSRVPTTYYGAGSGASLALDYQGGGARRRVGLVGLGAGTLAAYGRSADVFRFYEINPLVIDLANRRFRYLRESAAQIEIVLGDARLSLEKEPPQKFDVLLVDAFSGDSIPVHLLTREAFALYLRHLKPGGILAIHLSNRYLALGPVVDRVAATFGKRPQIVQASSTNEVAFSDWALITDDPAFQKLAAAVASPEPAVRPAPAWTDDYSNVFRALR